MNGKKIQYVIPKGTKLLVNGFDISSYDSQKRAKFTVKVTFAQMIYAFQSSFYNWKTEDYSQLVQKFALKSSNFKWAPANLPAVVGTKWEKGPITITIMVLIRCLPLRKITICNFIAQLLSKRRELPIL